MDNFIVSARKYRPTTFLSVVGQPSLTSTLKSAIASGKLAHSYLFCGPRGVGKTTCARIFAKTINCLNPTADHEACNECESCKAFNEQRSYNIHELDAASNNSVDDIRSLIEQVRIPPQIGNYSVYIIDEVHMLSPQAFNAFLKTLEEPPSYAIFIMATTEKHKVLPTILSRCQIFDFNRIGINDVVKQLQMIAEKEGIKTDVEGLGIIAQKADGAMRDALSIFDQVTVCTDGNVTYKNVIDNLNILDYDYYFKLVNNFCEGNISEALLTFNEILSKGFDAQHFVSGLSSHFRNLLVCKDEKTVSLMEVGDETRELFKKQAQTCEDDFLIKALMLANQCDLNYRVSKNKRLLVELMLIRLCQLSDKKKYSEIEELLSDIPLLIDPIFTKQNQSQSTVQKPQNSTSAVPSTTPTQPVAQPQKIVTTPSPQTPTTTVTSPRSSTVGHFSIFESLKEKEVPKEEEEKLAVIALNTPFTQEMMIAAWNKYIRGINDKQILFNTMESCKPTLTDNYKLVQIVDNSIQEKEMLKEKVSLLNFLRVELKNGSINLEVRVAELKDTVRILTPNEKLQKLVENYPKFEALKEKYRLELDYN
jgi:DNA polymerase-3 subunit gamma/tau